MERKTHKVRPKIADITTTPKTSKAAAGGPSPQLIIPRRAVIKDEGATGEPEAAPPEAAPKRKAIVPVDGDIAPAAAATPPQEPTENAAVQPEVTRATATDTPAATEPPTAEPTPSPKASTPPTADTAPAAPEPAPADTAPATTAEPTDQPAANDTKGNQTAKDKEAEETAKAVQRERELQEYIANRKYFVPLNAAARKRSIKVSLGLTLIVLLLGFVLVDLMLDTGIILLVQKIPHTHFFNLYN